MNRQELDALAADIKANGLHHPITLYGGQILDGRNRLAACQAAGVAPAFTTFEGDDAQALALVESLNVARRDLTAAQKALAAARRWLLEGSINGEPNKGGRPGKKKPSLARTVSVKELAAKYKVGKESIAQARDLLVEAPALAEQVDACTLSLAAAHEELKKDRAAAQQKARDTERISKYREAVSNGELSFDEALHKVIAEDRFAREEEHRETSARRLWHEGLEQVVHWLEQWSAGQPDDQHLRWYVEPGAPGSQHKMTGERLRAAARQLLRIEAAYFGSLDDGQATPRGRPRPASREGRSRPRGS
jgi:ParB-like chromosome segregation protein Spo0J